MGHLESGRQARTPVGLAFVGYAGWGGMGTLVPNIILANLVIVTHIPLLEQF